MGCFLCPTSVCTSVCPLARDPDEPLGYKRHTGCVMKSVLFFFPALHFKGISKALTAGEIHNLEQKCRAMFSNYTLTHSAAAVSTVCI